MARCIAVCQPRHALQNPETSRSMGARSAFGTPVTLGCIPYQRCMAGNVAGCTLATLQYLACRRYRLTELCDKIFQLGQAQRSDPGPTAK